MPNETPQDPTCSPREIEAEARELAFLDAGKYIVGDDVERREWSYDHWQEYVELARDNILKRMAPPNPEEEPEVD